MSKNKGKSSRKKGAQVEEVVQCPHLHFKTDVIDRNVLSKEQHLNLLSTPKGYSWDEYKKEGGDGGPSEELSSTRRILCSGRRMKKAEKVYVHNFLAEVWNLLTPEMVDRLKGMLMNEFGMSPQEADDFICKQREANIVNSSTVSFYKKPRDLGDGKYVYDHVVRMRNPNKAHCDKIPKSNLGIRNTWIKDFSDSLSEMMSSYVLETMCAERTDRQQEIAQTLLNRFNTLLEQHASMSDPKTPTDKTLVLVADRLATWLDNNVGVSKEAAQQIKIMGEAEKRKHVEEVRKRRHENMKKERERREAEEEAQRLANEQAQKLVDEMLAEEGEAIELTEGEEKDKSPDVPKEPDSEKIETAGELFDGPASEQKEEGEAQSTEAQQPKKESEEPDAAKGTDQDEQKEKDVEASAVAEEQQKTLDELKQKEEDEKAAVAAAAAEAEKLKAEEELKKTEEEEAAAKAELQRVEEEQKKAEQEAADAEKRRAEDEKRKVEQEVEDAEKQKAEEERIKAEEERIEAEKEAAELNEMEKQKTDDEQKKKPEAVEEQTKQTSEEPADEKPVAGLSGPPLEPLDIGVEDTAFSETTESEPPVSDVEAVPVLPTGKGDEVEPTQKLEDEPVGMIKPEVAGRVERGLSPEEKEKRTNEVLKSVASIILETKVDSSPRQEALKDIMEKQLEENLGDQDKEAIGKVSSKIGTWIDKMVDQATLEYGERETRRPPPGPDDIWAPASSRAQHPISGEIGMKAPAEPGLVSGVSATPRGTGWVPEVAGASTQPGLVSRIAGTTSQRGWIPGAPPQPGWTPGTSTQSGWVPGFSAAPGHRVPGTGVPIAQRPKGRIYHLTRTDNGFDVNMISNTRAQEKIRLARGKSPAYDNVPNPDAPMEPSDLKKWYNWTSALSEVAESWAEWIKDTITGTQQRGEEMVRDNSPQRLSEWREFRDNRAQSAHKWQQTKKDMEQRAEMWSKKRRRVQSQEANKFLRDQEKLAASTKPKSKQTLMKENQCDAATPMMIKNYLRKTFADIVAEEMEERIITAICGPRSKQKVDVAQRLLKLLVDVTGEQCTLQTPKTGTQRILVFVADQMAVWMIDAVDAADKAVVDRKERNLQGIEDGGKGDGKDEEEDYQSEPDVKIIHRKKRPSNLSSAPEGSGDGASEPGFRASKKPAAPKKSGADGKEASDAKAQSQSGARRKRPSTEGSGAGGKTSQSKASRDQPQRKEGTRKDEGERKPKTASQAQSGAKGSSDGRGAAQAKRSSADKTASSSRPEGAKPTDAQRSQSRTNVPPRRPSQTASKQDIGKSAAPARSSRQVSSSETKPVSESRRGSKSAEQRPRTASELQREKVGEMISSHISGMIKEGSTRQTPRAEALRDVISKKLEGSTMPLDQQGIDAIKEASILLAAYIDKQAETVELEYGTAPPPKAIAQRGKGPVFSVKRTASSFLVKEITHYDAAAKIAGARGRPAPGAITLSKGAFNSKETKEWAKWANDVVNMADKWNKWIDSTVSKAVASAEKKKAGQEVPDWHDWKETVGQEALEWRRNKKLLNQSAALFQDKVDRPNKPQSAPSAGPSKAPKDLPKKQ